MIVTLTTDFGSRDGYVAAMKGAMLSVEPGLQLVDVTHEVPPQDVMDAAFVLGQAAPYFPEGTVHLCVVDPGVGTDRRAIAARVRIDGRRFFYVGPDNGTLSLLLDGGELEAAVVLDRPSHWRTGQPGRTFHGRDLFGPVAARLAAGVPIDQLGHPIGSLERLHWPLPRVDAEGIDGMVLHIDRYGNCITNIHRTAFDGVADGRRVKGYVGTTILKGIAPTYGSVSPGEPLFVFGGAERLEVAVNGGHAASLLTISRGTSVNLLFETSRSAPARRPLTSEVDA